MKLRWLSVVAAAACSGSPATVGTAPREAAPVTARTGPPELVAGVGTPLPAYTADGYQDARTRYGDAFVALPSIPPGLSAAMRVGFNIVTGGKNVSWILDGDADRGFVVLIDRDADGDVTDEAPIALVASDDGHAAVVELGAGRRIRLVRDREGTLFVQDETVRRGRVRLGGRDVMFAVHGGDGTYNRPNQQVWFDLDGDGSTAVGDAAWQETFEVREKYVTLSGATWEFQVAADGDAITIVPTATRPQRPSLAPGSLAPDVSLDGAAGARHLSDLRGTVVLLDFWSQHCGHCVEAAPRLAALHARLRDRGFEIVGVSVDPALEARSFAAANGQVWPQILDAEDGPVTTLYRVRSYPRYFLIDAAGVIRCTGVECLDEERIGRLLRPR